MPEAKTDNICPKLYAHESNIRVMKSFSASPPPIVLIPFCQNFPTTTSLAILNCQTLSVCSTSAVIKVTIAPVSCLQLSTVFFYLLDHFSTCFPYRTRLEKPGFLLLESKRSVEKLLHCCHFLGGESCRDFMQMHCGNVEKENVLLAAFDCFSLSFQGFYFWIPAC